MVYALVDLRDSWHAQVVDWWERQLSEVLLPASIVPEVAYLLARRLGSRAEAHFIRNVADEEFAVEPLESDDWHRAASLMDAYSDLGLGFVDASVLAMAERLGVREIATTDRRHFSVVRPRHVERLRLVP
ncbi:MAG TPA: PIN domain-containing protein [Gemmatimonadales bacterium]|nr:PIN domain-containing protein [Gemmatimonadales bacterium]